MKNIQSLKLLILLTFIILFFFSCSTNEEKENFYNTTISGKVIRELTNEGIGGSKVYLKIVKTYDSGYRYTKVIDSKIVNTNPDGSFSVNMVNSENTHVTVFKYHDDTYSQYGLSEEFPTNQFNPAVEIVIKIQKLIKFRINIKNNNPFDSSDYIYFSFLYHRGSAIRTEILNFGNPNIIYPAEVGFGPRIETAWNGMTVNSAVFFSVSEDSEYYKLYWEKRKNGIFEKGVTNDIPHDITVLNEYNFNY